ncbi:NRDE family protein [Thermomonas sp. RSS23]|uniref:NRDE family protein n=1 Tax=Thermomonas beijingensis TaxID=2872701 RepID=A0ABS7TAN2_9GAMM|nr:NRDE family protein [Thermomonas beijingensis]MBZ4184912.1 NRDE family protein [Thermomonas beijingensis]
MCLVAFACNRHPRWRLVMVGNRDEFHPRPTAALAAWPDAPVLAGRDLRAGGTWMGLGRNGRVAVVTNLRDGSAQPFTGPSRGDLPIQFLTGNTDALSHAQAVAQIADQYAPFNLIVADTHTCAHIGPPASGRATQLTDGVHGISNGPLDAPWPKTRRLCTVLEDWARSAQTDLQPLWQALADERIADDADLPHTGIDLALERRLSAAFVRGTDYGTRACTVILVDHAGHGSIFERRFGPGGVFAGETVLHDSTLAST